jgi:hypothetical protein
VSVAVVPLLRGMPPQRQDLEAVGGAGAYHGLVTLTMPGGVDSLPLLVRFRQGGEEVVTLELSLDLVDPS